MDSRGENVLSPLPGNRPLSRNIPLLFRSPPQPHMCVQDTLKGTQSMCFINVMSWSKIGIPSWEGAPIPLYGGVKVPLSDRCDIYSKCYKSTNEKPLVFAVLVNPSILKRSGKTAENQKDRDGLIDLMLDFIETMNENITFSRNFTVLKDRDLTGELKDIWAVIQAKRDAEKSHHSTNHYHQRDENCQPCSPVPAVTAPNVKHKRPEEASVTLEPTPVSPANPLSPAHFASSEDS